jgi:hypothetical protein
MLVACGKDSTAPNVSIAGRWVGTISTQTLDMTLSENAGSVNGSGTISNTPTGTRALTITGTYTAGPIGNVNATFSSGSAQPFNLAGQVFPASILGSLTGSGFTGDVITMNRR